MARFKVFFWILSHKGRKKVINVMAQNKAIWPSSQIIERKMQLSGLGSMQGLSSIEGRLPPKKMTGCGVNTVSHFQIQTKAQNSVWICVKNVYDLSGDSVSSWDQIVFFLKICLVPGNFLANLSPKWILHTSVNYGFYQRKLYPTVNLEINPVN